jgi:hypothetical protein
MGSFMGNHYLIDDFFDEWIIQNLPEETLRKAGISLF